MSVACSGSGGGRGGRAPRSSSSANRMSAASCCDINISTAQQLLVTHVCWTKRQDGVFAERRHGCRMA